MRGVVHRDFDFRAETYRDYVERIGYRREPLRCVLQGDAASGWYCYIRNDAKIAIMFVFHVFKEAPWRRRVSRTRRDDD